MHKRLSPFSRDMLLQLVSTGLMDQRFALSLDPMMMNDTFPRISADAVEESTTMEVLHFQFGLC
jgi:hypothetical protein